MIIDVKYLTRMISVVAMLSLFACGEEPPPVPRTNTVSHKITNQPVQAPQKPAVQAETASLAQSSEKPNGQIIAQKTDPQTEEGTSDLVQASLEAVSTYDPEGRFDPFEPLFKEEPEVSVKVSTKSKRKRRIPQTPLERVALSQLKLSAIIRAPSGDRALVEDATGKGYVVINGTYIGLNSGKVIQIADDRIVVEEEIENVLGELIIQNTELKLQKPAGEL